MICVSNARGIYPSCLFKTVISSKSPDCIFCRIPVVEMFNYLAKSSPLLLLNLNKCWFVCSESTNSFSLGTLLYHTSMLGKLTAKLNTDHFYTK